MIQRLHKRTVTWTAVLICLGLGIGLIRVSKLYAKTGVPGVACVVEMDRGVLSTGRTQRAVVKVTLDAPPPRTDYVRPAVNLSIVLDRSGSMAGQKLEKARQGAVEALRRLGDRDIFSLVSYDHRVQTVVPARLARNVEWIEGRIQQIRSGGNTALFSGVCHGAAEIRKHIGRDYVQRLILLSDGIANVGPRSPEDLGRLGAALSKEGISVTTIGVGTDYNEDLMTRLSQNSDGNTYFVESERDLPRIFAAELGDVLDVVAQGVRMRIDCSNGVRPLALIGREGRLRGNSVELSLNQLYGRQQKYVLIEMEIPPGSDGEQRDIAVVTVSYNNPFTHRREVSTGHLKARFSDDQNLIKQSANVQVHRAYHLNLNALVQEEAIRLADEGKPQAAVKELKGSVQRLKAAGGKYGDTEMLQKAAKMEEQIGRIERRGMTKKNRKILRTDAYQQKNQQMTK